MSSQNQSWLQIWSRVTDVKTLLWVSPSSVWKTRYVLVLYLRGRLRLLAIELIVRHFISVVHWINLRLLGVVVELLVCDRIIVEFGRVEVRMLVPVGCIVRIVRDVRD